MPHPQLQHALEQLDASRAEQHARRQAANPPPDPGAQAEQHAQQAQQAQRLQAVRSWAAQLWQQAQPPDPQHPYLQRHAIQPVGARQLRNLLLIPLRIRQQLVNLQLIRPSGHSRLLCGTALDGAALLLGPLRGQTQLLLCVGWVSGCSLFHASGLSVIVALQTRNLVALAERLAVSLDPSIVLLVCGEITPGGAGQRAAARAALILGRRATTAFPPVQQHLQQCNPLHAHPPHLDFHQLQQQSGADAVRAVLQQALNIQPPSSGNHGNHGNHPAESQQPPALAPVARFPVPLSSTGNQPASAAGTSGPQSANTDQPDGAAPSSPPPGFVLQLDGPRPGVLYCGGSGAPLWLSAPLQVLAQTRDPHGQHWGRWLQWHDAEQRLHQWVMPAELTCGDGSELARILARGGLLIHPSRRARALLSAYILHSHCQQLARCTTHSGWHGNAFVLADQVIGADNRDSLLLQRADAHSRQPACGGSLQQWQQQIGQPAQAHSRLCFVLSLAFAAPLAALADSSGGFHLLGGSSIGKSSALDLAASVWGHPADWHHSWRATSNGLEGLCAAHNDLLLILDELAQLDSAQASSAAYLIANGQGKARAQCDGQLHSRQQWRVLLLSAGELQLDQLLQPQGQRRRAGQEVRLLDLPADAGHGCGILDQAPNQGSAADWLQRCAQAGQQHYGHAGRAFLQRLCAERTACAAELHAAQQAFVQQQLPADAAGQAIRAAQRFALVAYAGELASRWQLSGWPAGVAQQAASQLFQAWLQARGGSHDRELRDGMAAIKAYLERYADSRFTPWDQPDSRTEQRAGFCRQREDGPYFYVLPQAFRSELCNGHDPIRLARALAANGWLKTQSPDRLTVKTRLPGMGRTLVNVYLLTPLLWQG